MEPRAGLVMGSASAAQRPEARWPANDASGIRAAPGCGGVRVDAPVTSHGAAPTAAHVGCVVVCLMEPGRVSQLQSWSVVSRKAKVQPCPSTKDWEAPPTDPGPPSLFPSSQLPRLRRRPRDKVSMVPCAPESSSRARSWLCSRCPSVN